MALNETDIPGSKEFDEINSNSIGTPPVLQASMVKNVSRCGRIAGLLLGLLSPDPNDCRVPSFLNDDAV